jgi:hypothetical protein
LFIFQRKNQRSNNIAGKNVASPKTQDPDSKKKQNKTYLTIASNLDKATNVVDVLCLHVRPVLVHDRMNVDFVPTGNFFYNNFYEMWRIRDILIRIRILVSVRELRIRNTKE